MRSENRLCKTEIFLNVLRLVLWPSLESLRDRSTSPKEERVFCSSWTERFASVRQATLARRPPLQSSVFRFSVYLPIFRPVVLSVTDGGVSKPSPVIVEPSIGFQSPDFGGSVVKRIYVSNCYIFLTDSHFHLYCLCRLQFVSPHSL